MAGAEALRCVGLRGGPFLVSGLELADEWCQVLSVLTRTAANASSSPLLPLPPQGHASARSPGSLVQRIVVATRAAEGGPEPLHNSFSAGDYSPKKGSR